MTSARVCLTLIADRALRDELLDYLGARAAFVPGFTALEATGHGPTARLESPAERVKGRADRIMIHTVVTEAAAHRLIAELTADFAGANIVYWTSAVAEFGTLG